MAGGYTTSYGRACNLSYTFDAVNALTAVTDADDARYGAALTCDANGNITTVMEYNYSAGTPPIPESTLQTDFTYDDLNCLTRHQTTRYVGGGTANTQYVRREHEYDATGRLVKSSYLTWYEGDTPPSPSTLEHVYDGARFIQNYDGTNYGSVWHWAGAWLGHNAPLRSPNPDTASQNGYNIAEVTSKSITQRRTWLNATTEGDRRELFGEGRPQAKDSSGSGVNWYLGTVSDPPVSGSPVESRFFFEGTVAPTDMSRATDSREGGLVGVFGTSNSYGGSYGRVTNEALGRDLNPMGCGSGHMGLSGAMNSPRLSPRLPGISGLVLPGGNSVGADLGISMDSWLTQGLIPNLQGSSGCSSCANIAGTPQHPCGAPVNSHCPQDFCSAGIGWQSPGAINRKCSSWERRNEFFGWCTRCCCAPCCGCQVSCVGQNDWGYSACGQWMSPSQVTNWQGLLRSGKSPGEVLLMMCNKASIHQCGPDSDLCPPGYEGNGGDILSPEPACKCGCRSLVNGLVLGFMNAYREGGAGDKRIDQCMPILAAGGGPRTDECLKRGLKRMASGLVSAVPCGNPSKSLRCRPCRDRSLMGLTTGSYPGIWFGMYDITICCLNIERGSWNPADTPIPPNNNTCPCLTLSVLLHELVHAGGCAHNVFSGGIGSFAFWGAFMSCVCSSMSGPPPPPPNLFSMLS